MAIFTLADGAADLRQGGTAGRDRRGREVLDIAGATRARDPPGPPGECAGQTGQAQAQQATKDTSAFLGIFQDFLLAFGGVALFVGSFVIANTLSITVAQRTRELATLRTLGAMRRQVLRSVCSRRCVIGLLASVVGLFLGLGLAKGLNRCSSRWDRPAHAGTVFATRTVMSRCRRRDHHALAALRPALRATRVPPIAAVREGALLPPSRWASTGRTRRSHDHRRAGVDARRTVRRLAVDRRAPAGDRGRRSGAVHRRGDARARAGAAAGARLGAPAARFGGAAGSLARSNSIRNPSRTASTASALMIGLALVTLVGVLAAGLRSHFESA